MRMLRIQNVSEGARAELPNVSKYITSQGKYIDKQLRALKTPIWKHREKVQHT